MDLFKNIKSDMGLILLYIGVWSLTDAIISYYIQSYFLKIIIFTLMIIFGLWLYIDNK